MVVNLAVFALTLDAVSPSPTFNLVESLLHSASNHAVNPIDDFLASAVAFVIATLWNFLINNLWTFRSATGHRHPFSHRLGLYYGVSLGSLAVNEAVLFGLAFYLPPLYGQAVGIVAGSVVGFAGNYRVTFAAPGSGQNLGDRGAPGPGGPGSADRTAAPSTSLPADGPAAAADPRAHP